MMTGCVILIRIHPNGDVMARKKTLSPPPLSGSNPDVGCLLVVLVLFASLLVCFLGWFGSVRLGLVRFGLAWFGLLCVCVFFSFGLFGWFGLFGLFGLLGLVYFFCLACFVVMWHCVTV